MKILIAEDHALVREGLRTLLIGSKLATLVEETNNGLEAVVKTRTFKPDLVILDYEMPGYNGIYATRNILAEFPNMPILMVSMFQTKEHVLDAFRAGVKGFLPKESKSEELLAAIESLRNGHTWFKTTVAEYIAEETFNRQSGEKYKAKDILTRRENELLRFFAEGMSSQEISVQLNISKRTVEVHKANIFRKLNLKNKIELIRYSIRNNLTKI
jgi:DNA-binding NarL/FixJ family response regulator